LFIKILFFISEYKNIKCKKKNCQLILTNTIIRLLKKSIEINIYSGKKEVILYIEIILLSFSKIIIILQYIYIGIIEMYNYN